MESQIGLYKTELIKKRGPWKTFAEVELATAEYVEWFNSARLHSAIGHVPPAEYEAVYYAQTQPQPAVGVNTCSLHQTRGDSIREQIGHDHAPGSMTLLLHRGLGGVPNQLLVKKQSKQLTIQKNVSSEVLTRFTA